MNAAPWSPLPRWCKALAGIAVAVVLALLAVALLLDPVSSCG